MKRIKGIDTLRALACLMVYAYHVWQFSGEPSLNVPVLGSLGPLFQSFPAGVDLFVVLSGFCLFWPLAVKPESAEQWSASKYLKMRFRRIAPPYYLSIVYATVLPILLVLVMRAAGQEAKWQALPGFWQYLTHLTFTHTFFTSTWDGIQGVYWSLGLEAQFYLVFPLIILGFRKWGIRAVVGIIAASVLYRCATMAMWPDMPFPQNFLVSNVFVGRWSQFGAGMLAAWHLARMPHPAKPTLTFGALACAVGLYAAAFSIGDLQRIPFPTRELLLGAAFYALIIAVGTAGGVLRAVVENRVLTWLGFISYSVFLIHQITAYYLSQFLSKLLRVPGDIRFMLMMTVGLGLIIGVSYVFFICFEQPFHRARSTVPPAADPVRTPEAVASLRESSSAAASQIAGVS